MSSSSTPPVLGPTQRGASQRRRLLRKGTRSCIECKRRKIRCFFLSTADSKCVGCQRRGTTCLGQEFSAESAGFGRSDDEVARRLDRFETLLARVMDKTMPDRSTPIKSRSGPGKSVSGSASSTHTSSDQSPPYLSSDGNTSAADDGASSSQGSPSSSQRPETQDKIRQTLFAAFPSQHDAIVLIEEGGSYPFLHMLCNPLSSVFGPEFDLQAPIMSALPSILDHPAVMARFLLRLALTIQQLRPSYDATRLQMQETPHQAMARYASLANRLVTSDDRIIDTLEGYECLVLEVSYVLNQGNLRQGMVHLRRCLTLAQMAGLAGFNVAKQGPAATDPNTKVSFNRCWDRIVYGERYLALLLGIPSAVPVGEYDIDALEIDRGSGQLRPCERLDIFHAAIAGRIIARSRAKVKGEDQIRTTREIAAEFKKHEESFPASWWTQPDLPSIANDEPKRLMEVLITAQAQITHFNMQSVLHLPHLLSDASVDSLDTSKTICVSSSRQVLARYTALRTFIPLVSCCRFVDFCAFTAVTTLLLAHLVDHQVPEECRGEFERALAQRRLEDRALMERTMATMEQLNLINHDPVSCETAKLARSLLALESDAAAGGSMYNAHVVSEHPAEASGGYRTSGAMHGSLDAGMDVQVPYFGKVKIEKEESATSLRHLEALPISGAGFDMTASGPVTHAGPGSIPTRTAHDLILERLGPHVESLRARAPYPASQHGHQEAVPTSLPVWMYMDGVPADANGPGYGPQQQQQQQQQQTMHTAAAVENVQGWAFQGVDDMFFETLLRPSAVEDLNVWQ